MRLHFDDEVGKIQNLKSKSKIRTSLSRLQKIWYYFLLVRPYSNRPCYLKWFHTRQMSDHSQQIMYSGASQRHRGQPSRPPLFLLEHSEVAWPLGHTYLKMRDRYSSQE